MGDAYGAMGDASSSDLDRVAKLHLALGFMKAITAEAQKALPVLGESLKDHTIPATTRRNFQILVQGSNSLDLQWKEAFGEIR